MKHDRTFRPIEIKEAGRQEGEPGAAAKGQAGGDLAAARPLGSGVEGNGRAAEENVHDGPAARRKTKAGAPERCQALRPRPCFRIVLSSGSVHCTSIIAPPYSMCQGPMQDISLSQ